MSACINLIYLKANSLESTLNDFFTLFDRETIERRLERSEANMNENQELELYRLNYKSLKSTIFDFLSDLPDPKILCGINSNQDFNETCSFLALYKSKSTILIESNV